MDIDSASSCGMLQNNYNLSITFQINIPGHYNTAETCIKESAFIHTLRRKPGLDNAILVHDLSDRAIIACVDRCTIHQSLTNLGFRNRPQVCCTATDSRVCHSPKAFKQWRACVEKQHCRRKRNQNVHRQ